MQLELDLSTYLDCFDGVTFWIWTSPELANLEKHLEKLFVLTKDKPVMLGIYVFDYGTGGVPMKPELFETQLARYFDLLREGQVEGIIFCSGTLGDAPLETNRILKEYIQKYGAEEIV